MKAGDRGRRGGIASLLDRWSVGDGTVVQWESWSSSHMTEVESLDAFLDGLYWGSALRHDGWSEIVWATEKAGKMNVRP